MKGNYVNTTSNCVFVISSRANSFLFAMLFIFATTFSQAQTTTFYNDNTQENQSYTLKYCRELAQKNNAKLKNAELDIIAAEQTQKGVFTKYFPQVSITGGAFHAAKPFLDMDIGGSQGFDISFENQRINEILQTLVSVYGPYFQMPELNISAVDGGFVGGAMAVQPVFMGGRIVNGNKLAKLGIDAAKLQAEIAKNEIDLKTEELYWTIISLQEKTKILVSVKQLLDTLQHDATTAVNAGIIHKNDLLKVKLKQSEIKSLELQLTNGILLAKSALCQHIGIVYSENFSLSDSLVEIPNPQQFYVDSKEAVKNRSEYALLDLSVEAEALKRKMLIGEALPQIAVGGGYTCNTLMDKFGSNALMFATLSIPITGWWEKSHELKKQKVDYQKAVNQRQDLDEQMLLQMQMAWNDLIETYTQVQLSQQTEEMAAENLKLSSDNFKAGMISMSELLEAQTLLQQAQSQSAENKVNYMIKLTKYRQMVE